MDKIIMICSALVTVCSAITASVAVVRLAKAPADKLETRLTAIENTIKKHEELLGKDKTKIDTIEEGNRVTQKALLALLAHGIDGNSVEAMTDARDELQKYLINR